MPNEQSAQKVYLLCESVENQGIRNFSILACSVDKESLRELLQAKVKKDEHNFLGSHGIEDNDPDSVSSVYDDEGQVEYYITAADVLSREQTKALLQTPAYTDSFSYPAQLRNILLRQIRFFAEDENYGQINFEAIADHMMQDPSFRAMVKQAWWFDHDLSEQKQNAAGADCRSILTDFVWDEPDYFVRIGAIPPFNPPENLKDIVIDCIYDVCKANHLPVNKPNKTAAQIMRHSDFRDLFRKLFPNTAPLEAGSYDYLKAATYCTHFAKAFLAPAQEKPSLASQILSAESRQASPETDVPMPKDLQR